MSVLVTQLGWLLVDTPVLCVPCISFIIRFNLLDPSILFGPQHTYSTRCPPTFANIERHRLYGHRHFFAIREQSGGMTFLNPLLLHVTFHPLFIIIYYSYML